MKLLACGINHQTAPLPVREKVAFASEIISAPLQELIEQTKAAEAVILSTCNRTEFYCTNVEAQKIIDWLHHHKQLPQGQLNPYLYIHEGQTAIQHIMRVASGLDSMILGEPQILGQVKTAFSVARSAGTIGSHFKHLFQYIFSVTKEVRSQTSIGAHPLSLAFATVDLAKHIFADLSQINVLLVGAGETIEPIAKYLLSIGVKRFWVANRTVTKAEKLAAEIDGQSILLSAIPEYLPYADMTITATASALPILGKGMVENALKTRKQRPMLLVDLAVPRDIEPEVNKLDDVYLYTLDDLQNIVQQNLMQRKDAANQAEIIIEEKAAHYMHTLKALEAVPAIRAYRHQAELLRDTTLNKARKLLQTEMSVEEVLEWLANDLTNKLLHKPSVELRKAAYADQKEILAIASKILGLEDI